MTKPHKSRAAVGGMQIIERNIADLKPAEHNPRQLTADQHKHLTESLSRFGMAEPIIVNAHPDRAGIVVGGHQRLRVWRELGHATIPTVEVSLDLAQERELNVRLNRNLGEWDWDALANGFDISELKDWGFSPGELAEVPWEDYSENQKNNADRTTSGSASMLVCFGEFAGRVNSSTGTRALAVVRAYDEDPDAAATVLCERLANEG